MGLRAYLTGGLLALMLAWGGVTLWLWNGRSALLAERVELQRQVDIGQQLLEQARLAQAVADAALRDEAARRTAAEKQIRRILAAGPRDTQTEGDGHETDPDSACADDPIGCALDWLRARSQ
mgnify:CR=1 FL=1